MSTAFEHAQALYDAAEPDEGEEGEMTEHTPGPWTRDENDGRSKLDQAAWVRGPSGYFIASAFDFNRTDRDAEVEANARLIAAAPDLLAALVAYQHWTDLDADAAENRDLIDAATEAGDEFERLRDAALAKVKGG